MIPKQQRDRIGAAEMPDSEFLALDNLTMFCEIVFFHEVCCPDPSSLSSCFFAWS